jgi:hypothetical protein
MSYPLRLPPELDAEARERCKRLGISLNALIAVALDTYLRGTGPVRAVPGKSPAARVRRGQQPEGTPQPGEGEQPKDWRFFHPDPDTWPFVDPEFQHRWEGVDEDDEAACVALEIEYWSTRERPGKA